MKTKDTINLVGKLFGQLTVTKYVGVGNWHDSLWECRCACGNTLVVMGSNLRKGASKSCGCSKRKRHRRMGNTELKECYLCLSWKPLSDFPKNSSRWDGLHNCCKACSSKKTSYRIKNDINVKIKNALSGRMRLAIKSKKAGRTLELTGCTIESLKYHLESMFDNKMSWENYGKYWHIDHIIPCRAFDLTDPAQQFECFHYTNLQPMEAGENLRKNDTMPDGANARYSRNGLAI